MRLNKKIFVTGADGFIGSHLVETLATLGDEVVAFVYYNSFNHWGWLEALPQDLAQKITIVPGDIRDAHHVQKAMSGCQVVFHLAALIGIPYSYHAPESYVQTNVMGTLNILQAAQSLGLERVIVTSTSEVYGTAQYVPITESHPRQGQSPYSATKIAADALADSFFRSFNLPVTIVRPFNTYGPRQSARAVIPTIISQLLSGQNTVQLGSLSPTRDLVFVQDTVEGFLKIAGSKATIGEEINIATGQEISIQDLALLLISLLNPQATLMSNADRTRPEKSEVERLLGSADKLYELTGFKPNTPLLQGLQTTIEWFKKNTHFQYKNHVYNV